jgi:hypothetical protein
VLFPAIALNFVVWGLLGFVLAALSLAQAVRESSAIAVTRHKAQRDKDAGEQSPPGDAPKIAPEE